MEIGRHCAEVGDQELHYLQAGSGPPLVLIHGLLGGYFCWRFNVPALAQQHTVFALDLPGFGLSVVPRKLDCSMEAQAFRLLLWLEHLGLESVDVVASSWGGGVALLLAALTSRVRSLVLAAPVNPWSDFGRERVRFFSRPVGGALLRLGMPLSRPLHPAILKRLYGDPSRIPAGTMEGYSQMMLCKGRVHNLLNIMRCWSRDLQALSEAIDRVRTPVLLIWGAKDGAVDVRSSNVLLEKLPDSERVIIAGAGHIPFEEAPEEFNGLVLGFLERIAQKARPA
ncbi:MAG TPA: alpha/beta fold hydrolase [Candidatus Angelobacter sp.]|nr:alpha/beta fold hydrolase [Candidatus Angelobacter sp.]